MRLSFGVLVVCACGSSDGTGGPTPIDAPPAIDGLPAIDAAPATGPVNVTVRNSEGNPSPGVPVATQLLDGNVLMVATTGTDGTAVLQTVAGGSVTVGLDEDRAKRLVTITGLTFGQSVLFQARPPQRMFADSQVLTPPAGPPSGTVGYMGQIPCRFGGQTVVVPTGTPANVPITTDCIAGAKYSAAITAIDAHGAPLAYSFQENITQGAPPVFPPWMTDITSFTLAIGNASPCNMCARLDTYRRTAKNFLYFAGGAPLSFPGDADVALAVPHAPSLPAPETGVVLTIDLDQAKAIVRRSTGDAPAADSIDLAELLPQITALAADASGSRLRLHFDIAAANHAPRVAVFELAWREVIGDDVVNHVWTVLTPPPAGDGIDLPLLPPELGAFAPALPGDPGDYTPAMMLVDDTAFASYAALAASDWEAEIGGFTPTSQGKRTVTISSRP